MNLNDLVGKNVIRTECAKVNYGKDESYTRECMGRILKVTDAHAVYETKSAVTGDLEQRILNHYWLDDKWVDYDELMNIEEE